MLTLPTTPSPRPGEDGSILPPATAPFPRSAKATPMHIRYKFGQLGGNKGQFNSPHGFCLGNEEDIIVADTNNHRITVCIQFMLFNRTYSIVIDFISLGLYDFFRYLKRQVLTSFILELLAKKKANYGILVKWL